MIQLKGELSDIAEDIETQLIEKIKKSKLFAL